MAQICRKLGTPPSATASPPPGNRIVSLAGTACGRLPPPRQSPLTISRLHRIPFEPTIPIQRSLSLFVGNATTDT